MDKIGLKESARAILYYEDWKDSPERYEWSKATNKDRCCRWLHSKREPCPCDCCGRQECIAREVAEVA